MTLPRPALLGIAGLVAIMAAFLVMRALTTDDAPRAGPVAAAIAPTPAGVERSLRPAGLPPAMAGALRRREVIVLLLADPRAADDRATVESLQALARRPPAGVSVFSDTIDQAVRYRSIVAGLDVTQTPSIVIVPANRRARLLEGFVDEGTLRQTVEDVRAR